MKNIFFLIFLFSAFIFSACKEARLLRSNLSMQYDSEQPYHLFRFALFHKDPDLTELQFRIPLHEFLMKPDSDTSDYKSEFLVTYEFFEDYKTKHLIDSATIRFSDSTFFRTNYWYDYIITLPRIQNDQGILKLRITHPKKDKLFVFNFLFNKKDPGNRQYFFTEHKELGRIPHSTLSIQDTFKIHLSTLLHADSLFVAYFKPFREIAQPPFSSETMTVFPWKPDTLFTISIKNNETEFLNFRKPGLYHFMPDTSLRHGYTIYITRSDFPLISNHRQMVGPLRYISSNKEFRKIATNPDSQAAIEDFWLSISSNPDVARRLIKDYYNRVQYANVFFTSYKDGWMTDRGMIYIVMGQPNIVYASSFSEIWIYGEDKNYYSLTYEFRKVLNPLSDNDFILTRNPTFREKWYKAVDFWRKK